MADDDFEISDGICGPYLRVVKGSEIEACVDTKAKGTDGIFRPVLINQDTDYLNLTIADAERLLAFLNEAIPYMEGKNWEKQ